MVRLLYLSASPIANYTLRLRTCSDVLTFVKIRKSENYVLVSQHND